MTPVEYDFFVKFLKDRSGLALGPKKEYLLQSRLGPIVRTRGLASLGEMMELLRRNADESLAVEVTEAMTTNESFFFRDKTPFDLFKDHMVPSMIEAKAGGGKMRIWSAAASTGQEPYTLAMLLKEMSRDLAGMTPEIVATDISNEVLERARTGLYTQFEVQRGLPIKLMMKYFRQVEESWEIDAGLRSMIKFEQLNLLDDFSRFGTFDIVYCRNVLIYFDEPTKRDILARLAKRMNPGGFLVLGAAETIMGLTSDFKTVPGKQGLCVLDSAGGTASVASTPPAAGVSSTASTKPDVVASAAPGAGVTASVRRPLRVSNA